MLQSFYQEVTQTVQSFYEEAPPSFQQMSTVADGSMGSTHIYSSKRLRFTIIKTACF